MFSTLEDGKIVKGLAGVPNEGPVLIVGYHMLMGLELTPLGEAFLREKNIMVRGLAHPTLFSKTPESSSSEFSLTNWMRVFGAVPVTPSNLFKLLSTKSHVLLYPGGAREALHHKGEEYKLFWPDQQEFVRMAARFGATIVPFGAVGEDDISELVLDYNDLMKIPVVNDHLRDFNRNFVRVRDKTSGEVANQELSFPVLMPKIPGRFYYLFGKPIKTKGREDILKDKQVANQLYFQIKSEVERNMEFLIKKRQEDPYRSIVDRTLYKALNAPSHEVPTFEP
uniref:Acyltransferase n=1 Tax=Fagus sylvatica TaxID=28930 RepID=A0A2N9IQH0_FAGSY